MSIAHESMDIPQIAGLPVHPVQVEEKKRLAALRAANPDKEEKKNSDTSGLPKKTREILERLSRELLTVSNQQSTKTRPGDRAGNQPKIDRRTPG